MPVQLTSEFFDMTTVNTGGNEPRIVFLAGSKIDLVIIEKRDVRTLTTHMNDPQVTRCLLRHMPLNIKSEEDWIESLGRSTDKLGLGIVRKDDQDGTLIGTVGLGKIERRDRTAILGISIGDKSEWGKGYGTEAVQLIVKFAFDRMDMRGVELCVFGSNQRAIKVYQKCGFVEVGRIPHWLYLSPGVYDAEVMMVCMRPE